jgi:hypothetical protein
MRSGLLRQPHEHGGEASAKKRLSLPFTPRTILTMMYAKTCLLPYLFTLASSRPGQDIYPAMVADRYKAILNMAAAKDHDINLHRGLLSSGMPLEQDDQIVFGYASPVVQMPVDCIVGYNIIHKDAGSPAGCITWITASCSTHHLVI